jgi:RNA 2',3'-cyclic 3'-phosphodiesterase
LRLFFALRPDEATTAQLVIAAGAVDFGAGASLVARGNYHLTLAFLGEVAESQLSELRELGRDQRARACTIKFDGYEYWPESKVVVASAQDVPFALAELSERLQQNLCLQISLRPHVTLARKVAQAPVLSAMSVFDWRAQSFSLMCSHTGGGASVYTVVDTWSLLDEMPKP